MSSSPSLPKPGSTFPVLAFSAMSLRPTVNKMRGGLLLSPGQYATPRREGAPSETGYSQSFLPVSGSRATTRSAAGTYMTPLTTIGVASELGPRPLPGPFCDAGGVSDCRRYVQAMASPLTFWVVIWSSGEYPVPAVSCR